MKGIYLLILHLREVVSDLQVGRLGPQHFVAGYYLYVGDAYGSGGLKTRLAYHHLQHKARPREHIDYLRSYGTLLETWSIACDTCRSCRWVRSLLCVPQISLPLPGFGGGAGCSSRLLYTPIRPSLRVLTESLLESLALECGQEQNLLLEITVYEEDA